MYQSVVDKLKISVEDLLTIDETQIIKFEKILKAQLVINNTSFNAEDNNTILALLKDPIRQKFIYIIEKHPKLKSYLSNVKPLESKTLSIDESLVDSLNIDVLAFREFIEPYLKTLLLPQLKEAMNRNQFFFVLDKIKNDWLFSEDIKFECQKILLNKILVTTHYLETHQNPKAIKYIKDKSFTEVIKQSAYGYGTEHLITYVETVARKLRQIHPRTKSATLYIEALIAVKNAQTDHVAMDAFIENHMALHIVNAANKRKSPEEWAEQIGLTALLISVMVIVALVIRANNERVEIISYTQEDTREYKAIFEQFYGSQITNDAMGVLKSIEAKLILKAYQYPYKIKHNISQPPFFPFYETFPEADSAFQKTITIENLDIDKSLIVFRKNTYNHCVILKPRERLVTFVEPNDSLIFYKGKQLNINDLVSPKDPFNGTFKDSDMKDRIQFFQVYIVDSLHQNKRARIQMTNYGILKFENIKTTKKTTSYVGKNFIDLRLLESYLD